jgi:glycosyltransferase involved in cell wall biosynthesis
VTSAPDVSVILIVRNGERFIADALESVVSGTCVPGEILVIDGGSSDRTAEIARAFAGVTVIPQTGLGIANAYNQGIAAARGEYVAFISHDDVWMPNKLELQLEVMRSQPGLCYTVTHVQHVLHDSVDTPSGFRDALLEAPVPGFIMETLVARREVFGRVGLFDPSFVVGEDTDWFARARDMSVPLAVLPELLVIKRVHGANASLTQPNLSSTLLRAMRGSIQRKRANLVRE